MAADDSLVDLGEQLDSEAISHPKESMVVTPTTGRIAGLIGTGTHADKNIVFYIIQYCLIAGTCLSVVVLGFWMLTEPKNVPGFVDIWHIFGPFITLALGYLFGRNSN